MRLYSTTVRSCAGRNVRGRAAGVAPPPRHQSRCRSSQTTAINRSRESDMGAPEQLSQQQAPTARAQEDGLDYVPGIRI